MSAHLWLHMVGILVGHGPSKNATCPRNADLHPLMKSALIVGYALGRHSNLKIQFTPADVSVAAIDKEISDGGVEEEADEYRAVGIDKEELGKEILAKLRVRSRMLGPENMEEIGTEMDDEMECESESSSEIDDLDTPMTENEAKAVNAQLARELKFRIAKLRGVYDDDFPKVVTPANVMIWYNKKGQVPTEAMKEKINKNSSQ